MTELGYAMVVFESHHDGLQERGLVMTGVDEQKKLNPFVIAALDAAIHGTICPMDYPLHFATQIALGG